jgi:iron complex transport system substrate-binding protein
MPLSAPRIPSFSRRGVLATGAALGLGALATACGGGGGDGGGGSTGSSGSGTATATATGPWTFRDDRGTTVRLDAPPRRLVAFVGSAAALHDFGIECTGVFGPTRLGNGAPDPQAGSLDIDRLTVLGNTWGEFNIEKYAALRPDLLISNMYLKDTLWYVPDESKGKISALAPSVAISATGTTLLHIVQRYAQLAESLGADLRAQQVAAAKSRFEKAAETLRTAARANGGLKVMAASGSADLFYVSLPTASADLRWFQELGVDFVVPKRVQGGFFESLSWEKAGTYHADLILLDSRSTALQPKDLAARPTWAGLPAVKAGQVIAWHSEPQFSYAGAGPLIEALAAAVRDAKKLS